MAYYETRPTTAGTRRRRWTFPGSFRNGGLNRRLVTGDEWESSCPGYSRTDRNWEVVNQSIFFAQKLTATSEKNINMIPLMFRKHIKTLFSFPVKRNFKRILITNRWRNSSRTIRSLRAALPLKSASGFRFFFSNNNFLIYFWIDVRDALNPKHPVEMKL